MANQISCSVELSFVTETVMQTQPAQTITMTMAPDAVTVTQPGAEQTVTEVITAACEVETPPAEGLPIPPVVVAPTPNDDGNGVGVSTIPIEASALPRTTLSYDPLESLGESSKGRINAKVE